MYKKWQTYITFFGEMWFFKSWTNFKHTVSFLGNLQAG